MQINPAQFDRYKHVQAAIQQRGQDETTSSPKAWNQKWFKSDADKRLKTKMNNIEIGDHVLLRNKIKNKTTPIFDPRPHIVTNTKGSIVTTTQNKRALSRNSSFFKRKQITSFQTQISRKKKKYPILQHRGIMQNLPKHMMSENTHHVL
jgi:hypothetical protein